MLVALKEHLRKHLRKELALDVLEVIEEFEKTLKFTDLHDEYINDCYYLFQKRKDELGLSMKKFLELVGVEKQLPYRWKICRRKPGYGTLKVLDQGYERLKATKKAL